MDNNRVETGLPGRQNNPPSEMSPALGLEARYTNLDVVLSQCDRLIPHKGKQRMFTSADASVRIRESLQSHFPDPIQQDQVIKAAANFLQGIASHLYGDEDNDDTIPFGQLDKFLTNFPTNMIDRLGDYATSETVAEILQIGSHVVKNYMHGKEDYPPQLQELLNGPLGTVTMLVGEAIPEAVAHAKASHQTVLDQISNYASTLDPYDLQRLVEHYQKAVSLSPQAQVRISEFEVAISRIDPELGTHSNPFNKSDREPWRNRRIMGTEKRTPTWADIGDMVRSSEQDNREYGIAISRNPHEDGNPILEYLRGTKQSIFNGERRRSYKENVFLHTHPSPTAEGELVSPLVSTGDLIAAWAQDYGGGYLNVASVNGITLHIGGLPVESVTASQSGTEANYIYTVESGQFKGSRIAPTATNEERLGLMRKLKESGLPYVYSIYDATFGIQYYFIQIPWGHINHAVQVEDLCFENGLAKLLPKIEGLPEQLRPQNLHQAMINTNSAYRESFSRKMGRKT